MATDPIVRRIEAALHAPGLTERLASMPGSDLQSLLLAVARARAAGVTPAALLAQAERGLVRPSSVDARRFRAAEALAFDAAPGFEAVDLAPVSPFGVDAVLGRISPNNVLPAIRPVQVVADSTSAMALEAARRRRRARDGAPVRLCASARLVRLQPIGDNPDFTPHFRLFALVTAGRDVGGHRFELDALRDHVLAYLGLLGGLRAAAPPGPAGPITGVEVTVSDADVVRALIAAQGGDPDAVAAGVHATDADGGAAALAARGVTLPAAIEDPDRDLTGLDGEAARAGRARLAGVRRDVFPAIRDAFPDARLRLDGSRVAGLGYYRGLTLQIWVTWADGVTLPLADGGLTDWTQRLLADRKERLLTSAIGLELLLKR